MCALFRVTATVIEQGHKLIEHTGEQAFEKYDIPSTAAIKV